MLKSGGSDSSTGQVHARGCAPHWCAAFLALGALRVAAVPADTSFRAAFDVNEAVKALAPGSSELKGRASAWTKGGLLNRKLTYGANVVVYLYPMTSYMQAWYDRYKDNPVLGELAISEEAVQFTARVVTDENGNFHFRGLKPGKYLLTSTIVYEKDLFLKEDTGSTRIDFNYFSGVATASPIYNYRAIKAELRHDIYELVDIPASGALDVGTIR